MQTNWKIIAYPLILVILLIHCWTLHTKTKQNNQWITNFYKDEVNNTYNFIEPLRMCQRQDSANLIAKTLIETFKSIKESRAEPYEKTSRKILTSIADSLQLSYEKHASNAQLFTTIAAHEIKFKPFKNNAERLLLVDDIQSIDDISSLFTIYCFYDSKDQKNVHLEFIDGTGKLTEDQIKKYKGNFQDVHVLVTNPVSGISQKFKPK